MGGVAKLFKKISPFGSLARKVDPLLGLVLKLSGEKKQSPAGGEQAPFIPGPDETPIPATLLSPDLPSNLNLRPPPTASDPAIAQARLRERRRGAATSGLRTILTSRAGLKTPASTAPRVLIGNKKIPTFSPGSFNTLLGG